MKKIKILSLFALLATAFTACDTPNIGGDDPQSYGDGETIIAQFTKSEETGYFLQDNGDTYTFNAAVDFVGANDLPLSSDLVVTYEVDVAATTAVAGTDYDFVDATGQVTIPAGSTFANIPISVYSANLDNTSPTQIVLNITAATASGYNVLASGNHGTTTIILQATCASNMAGAYHIDFTSGTTYVTVTEVSPGIYRASYFPTFSGVYWFEFADVCGRLTITDWEYEGSYPITATPGYMDTNGDIVFTDVTVANISWYNNLSWTLIKD